MDLIQQLDGNILLWIQNYIRRDFLNPIILFITNLGDAGWFWILVFAVMLIFTKYRKIGLTGLAALLIGFFITNLCLKNMVARIRPYEVIEGLELIGKRANDFSFPSGHSTCSMAASIVLFAKMPKKIGVPALILGILICFSRLYIGIHYLTDIIVGMCVGIIAALLAMYLIKQEKTDTLSI